jgi:hypothetical protein
MPDGDWTECPLLDLLDRPECCRWQTGGLSQQVAGDDSAEIAVIRKVERATLAEDHRSCRSGGWPERLSRSSPALSVRTLFDLGPMPYPGVAP